MNLPASHASHSLAPEPDDLPAAHKMHTLALAFDHVPPSHLVHALLLASEYSPLEQLKHSADPGFENRPPAHTLQLTANPSEYVPASHAVQLAAAVSMPVLNPAAHARHCAVCATGAYRPILQSSQLEPFTYSPAEQSLHWVRSTELNLPFAHSAQTCCPVSTL